MLAAEAAIPECSGEIADRAEEVTGTIGIPKPEFFGGTVDVAARVASAANGGQILVSQKVQEGLGGVLALGGARSLSLKGLTGLHAVFPLLWM